MRVLPPLIIEEAHITEFVERLSRGGARTMRCPAKRPEQPGPFAGCGNLNRAPRSPHRGHDIPDRPGAGAPPPISTRRSASPFPGRNARGRLVRLGPVLDEILSAHDYPAPIARILSEALVLTALLGAMLKEAGGQLTLQAQTESGIVDLLVCDYRGGELRGYVRFDRERLAELPSHRDLVALFGKGYLAITFDQAVTGERYQGIVPLEGGSLAEAAQSFFSQSEQIPSLVRLAVDDTGHVAGGILVQHLPEGRGGARAAPYPPRPSRMGACPDPRRDDQGQRADRSRRCRSRPAVAAVPRGRGGAGAPDRSRSARAAAAISSISAACIARFGAEERAEMVDEDGFISVDCEFCSRVFPISLSDFDD